MLLCKYQTGSYLGVYLKKIIFEQRDFGVTVQYVFRKKRIVIHHIHKSPAIVYTPLHHRGR